jgi:hypothetical protein
MKSKHLVSMAEMLNTSLIVIQARSFDYGVAFAQDDELRSNIVPSPTGKANTAEEINRPHPSMQSALTPSPSGEGYNKEGKAL